MNTGSAITALITLFLINAILLFLYISYLGRANRCTQNQSASCLNLTCPYNTQAEASQNKGCGNYAYRLNSRGVYECANEGIVMAIK